MKIARVQSRCECQAVLVAELDEQKVIIRGYAKYRGRELVSPANAIGTNHQTFSVGWSCPVCTRNTLRTFNSESLTFTEAPTAAVKQAS